MLVRMRGNGSDIHWWEIRHLGQMFWNQVSVYSEDTSIHNPNLIILRLCQIESFPLTFPVGCVSTVADVFNSLKLETISINGEMDTQKVVYSHAGVNRGCNNWNSSICFLWVNPTKILTRSFSMIPKTNDLLCTFIENDLWFLWLRTCVSKYL